MTAPGVRSDTCRRGHPWTEATTYIQPSTGNRTCRRCASEGQAARRGISQTAPVFLPAQWMARALCVGAPDPDLWFPEKGRHDVATAAKAVCAGCPVQAECLKHAQATGAVHGVWGGLAPEERDGRRARRAAKLSPAARERKAAQLRERRRRVREAAAGGDLAAAEWLERDRARKRVARRERRAAA